MATVTLSFDNGPDPEITPLVLDILGRRGLRSTFFVLGDKLRDPARRALCERAHAEGHWIGNHTFNHLVPLGVSPDPRIADREIEQTQDLIGELAHPDRLFRPMGGGGALGAHLLNRLALEHLVSGCFSCVLWNVVPRDWERPDGWVEPALAECAATAWPLVVLHDIKTGAMAHLDRFLGALADRGDRVVQEFPPDCVPLRRGTAVSDMQPFVSG